MKYVLSIYDGSVSNQESIAKKEVLLPHSSQAHGRMEQ